MKQKFHPRICLLQRLQLHINFTYKEYRFILVNNILKKNIYYVQDQRKRPPEKLKDEPDEEEDEQKLREESGLSRSGRLFGGLINDIKRKSPW